MSERQFKKWIPKLLKHGFIPKSQYHNPHAFYEKSFVFHGVLISIWLDCSFIDWSMNNTICLTKTTTKFQLKKILK